MNKKNLTLLFAFAWLLNGCETELNTSIQTSPNNGSLIVDPQAVLIGTPTPAPSPTSSLKTQAIAAGDEHACAILVGGGVKCWGNGFNGELGNGKTGTGMTHTSHPVDVVGLAAGLKAIVAGKDHTCVLTSQDGVKCWGVNSDGQLGNGTLTNSTVPVDVLGLTSGVAAISARYLNTCALTQLGAVKCWGSNSFGQIGDGTTTKRNQPTDVIGLPPTIKVVSVGGLSACALTAANGVLCWGNSDTIGNEQTTGFSTRPLDVIGLSSGVAVLTGGDLVFYAVMNDGGVQGWGADGNGQLGDGLAGPKHRLPIYLPALGAGSNTIGMSVHGSGTHACAIRTGTPIKCWGKNDYHQATADGESSLFQPPTDVVNLTDEVTTLVTGLSFTCGLTKENTVKCWGKNDVGQLGDGTLVNRASPGEVIF